MSKTALLQAREVVTVNLTKERVTADKAESIVPKGFRLATPQESAAYYRNNAEFRNDLYNNGYAWTGQIGLQTSGPQKINKDGSTSKISGNEFSSLSSTPEERSWHYSGSGRVAVDDVGWGRGRWLGVIAVFASGDRARVAYVPLSQAQTDLKASVQNASSAKNITPEMASAAKTDSERLEREGIILPDSIKALIRASEQ